MEIYYLNILKKSLTNAKWHSVAWPNTMTTIYRSDFIPIHDVFTVLDLHITFATGVARWQGTLTPPDTWSRHIWDLDMFYLLRTNCTLQPSNNLYIPACEGGTPSPLSKVGHKWVCASPPPPHTLLNRIIVLHVISQFVHNLWLIFFKIVLARFARQRISINIFQS